MRMLPRVFAVALGLVVTFILTFSTNTVAQVLEATLYGVVQDTSGAILRGGHAPGHYAEARNGLRLTR